jgi:hypothetical protein
MQAIKHEMSMNKMLIPFLFFPWIITELIETIWYIIKPSDNFNKPSFENSFNWI